MKQTTPYVVGAMRLLAGSYEPEELNRKAFSLYCDFRPEIEPGKSGWEKTREGIVRGYSQIEEGKGRSEGRGCSRQYQ
jgi:hypothetical protein